jgi:signal transduction histidine kinase
MAMRALEGYRLPLKVGDAVIRDVRAATTDTIVLNVAPLKLLIGREATARVDVETPRAMLQDTLHGLEQMRELVDNLRDFTRVDRSTTARFDLGKSLHNVLYIAKSVMPTAILVVEDFGDVPEVSGNVSQLNQAFLNLVNNAAQAIEGAGTITVRTFLDGARVRVDIADTGTGIPAEHLPHIWESYYTTKRPGEGTGLGLSIARAIVTDHGGEITVATRTGEHSGTTFSVFLPTAT